MLRPISCYQGCAVQAVEVFPVNLRLANRQQPGEPGTDSGLGRDEARLLENQISNTGTDSHETHYRKQRFPTATGSS